ncbi:MAG: adenylyl-sulfate kinase [Nitrospirae bacterium]|nr:adenylyl-sulfate kinase [Nitrospirota bacterium]
MPYVIWITGLPGSGKSTVASALKDKIPHAEILRMDDLRRVVTPEPTYSEEEREHLYRSLVYMAKTLYELGHTVIIDATGNRKSWRELARNLVPDFFEIHLKCPLEVCMERESSRTDTHGAPKDIYKKGKAGAPVPGMQVPYEETERPELVIDTEKKSVADAVGRIMGLTEARKGKP